MKLNKIKQTLCALFSVVLTTFIILAPIEVKAGGWNYKCTTDKITGVVEGQIYGPETTGEGGDITSALRYTEGKDSSGVYLWFSYLNLDGDDENGISVQQIFKPKGEPERRVYITRNNRWLIAIDGSYALENMKKQNELVMRLPYYRIGDVVFSYSLIGFQSVLAKMQASCKFK